VQQSQRREEEEAEAKLSWAAAIVGNLWLNAEDTRQVYIPRKSFGNFWMNDLDRIAVLYLANSRDRDIKLLPSTTHSRTQLVNQVLVLQIIFYATA